MNMIEFLVHSFIERAYRGETEISELLIEKFGELCKKAIRRQFSDGKRKEYSIRMSGIGRPLCQQQLEASGLTPSVEYNLPMKFLIGDLVEAVAMVILEAAGVNIEEEQKPVSLQIGGIKLDGTMDVKIDGEIWDVKSASDFAFNNKFGEFGGFLKILEQDDFGYITQGYCYSEAEKARFGGWIAINKVTGEWAVVETPELDDEYRKQALERVEFNIKTMLDPEAAFVKFDDIPEIAIRGRGKKRREIATGNRTLCTQCTYCGFKNTCWPDVTYARSVKSQAENPPFVWYSKYVTDKVPDDDDSA